MMRRFLLIFFICLCFCFSAAAEVCIRFTEPVYVGISGREVQIQFERTRKGPDGEAVLLDGEYREIGRVSVRAEQEVGRFTLSLTEAMADGQTLTLLFLEADYKEAQDECLLAVDTLRDGVRKVETDEKKIAITFDSSNGVSKLPQIIDLLDRYQISCTFFLQGEFAKNNPDMVLLIRDHGHEIANHSMHHPDMREIENRKILRDITQCNEALEAVTGQPVTLYRPPSGYYTYRDRAISRALGCEMILWTFDSNDGFQDKEMEDVLGIMNRKSEPGAIILMHIYGQHTLTVLEEYLPAMLEQGYTFCTVTELLESAST